MYTDRYIGNRLVLISHDEERVGVLETVPKRVEKEPMSNTSIGLDAIPLNLAGIRDQALSQNT